MKNRPQDSQPYWDYLRVIAQRPLRLVGYRFDRGRRLAEEPLESSFMRDFGGWYHPATAWERERFRQMGGVLE